jgi:rubrerythrin
MPSLARPKEHAPQISCREARTQNQQAFLHRWRYVGFDHLWEVFRCDNCGLTINENQLDEPLPICR